MLSCLRVFVCVHVSIYCRYDWMFAIAMFRSLCVSVYFPLFFVCFLNLISLLFLENIHIRHA